MIISKSKIEFFNSYFNFLEENDIQSVILHTYADYPEKIHSDVDYCVGEADLGKIIPLINQHCYDSGWRLVQILQHEVKAFFCICVSQSNPSEYVELDVCSDYMREGKILLRAEWLLQNRRALEGKAFYVPAVGREFCYTLWKSVAKKKSKEEMLGKLDVIYEINPEECEMSLIQSNMVVSEVMEAWCGARAEEVYAQQEQQYADASKVGVVSRFVKLLRRVVQPSGLLILVDGSEDDLESHLGSHFYSSIKPCFRKVGMTIEKVHLINTSVKLLKSSLVLCNASKLIPKTLYLPAKMFSSAYKLKLEHNDNMIGEVHAYLERRLQKRWGLKANDK